MYKLTTAYTEKGWHPCAPVWIIHTLKSVSSYITPDTLHRMFLEVLVTPLLRPQSFALAGWWSPRRTQRPGI